MGADEKDLKQQLELQKRLFEIVKTEKDPKTARDEAARRRPRRSSDALPEDQRKGLGDVDALVEGQIKMVQIPWFRYFLDLRPAADAGEGPCPVLALIGEKDLQVPPKENLAADPATLKAAGNTG